jgi:sigma-B regulation protein RsbU (phosphoserine phosphatase)
MLTGKLRQDVKSAVRLEREAERWRQDLARAREIQQGMLPGERLLTDRLELAGVCSQASEVGGDFYDYLCPDDASVGLIIGDVTGHGFYAGLFVAMAKSCLHTQARQSVDPREVMAAMRRTLDLSLQRRLLMSCCYILFDAGLGCLHYANAGHPYPYLYRASDQSMTRLEALDPILGALDASAGEYAQHTLPWAPGDMLVMYTDGVTEARDGEGRMFEHDALEACIAAAPEDSAQSILKRILEAVSSHAGDGSQDDDLTLVVVKAT